MLSAGRPAMNIREREPGDLDELKRRVRREKNADQRDRLRAVVPAIEGEGAPTHLGRSRRQVQQWVYAYRDRGIDSVHPPRRPDRKPRVHGGIAARLKARLDAGPTADDKVCMLRGKAVPRAVEAFGAQALASQAVMRDQPPGLPRGRHGVGPIIADGQFPDHPAHPHHAPQGVVVVHHTPVVHHPPRRVVGVIDLQRLGRGRRSGRVVRQGIDL